VSRVAIEQAMSGGRLTTVVDIGAALKAGTNCGSCIPEIEEILHAPRAKAD
jgi:assimilatory nitrate reductase catalytic subunit